jgi:uncharacterized protein with beta-barrel porin domain
MAATRLTPGASWARASIGSWRSIPTRFWRCAGEPPGAHDWVSDPTLTPAFQVLPGASFVVDGATPAQNAALASAGGELRLANGLTLLAKFDGEFASRSSTYAGTASVRYRW